MAYSISKIRGRWVVTRLLPSREPDTWLLWRSKGFASETAAQDYALKISKQSA